MQSRPAPPVWRVARKFFSREMTTFVSQSEADKPASCLPKKIIKDRPRDTGTVKTQSCTNPSHPLPSAVHLAGYCSNMGARAAVNSIHDPVPYGVGGCASATTQFCSRIMTSGWCACWCGFICIDSSRTLKRSWASSLLRSMGHSGMSIGRKEWQQASKDSPCPPPQAASA
jgi:hypothetical protein